MKGQAFMAPRKSAPNTTSSQAKPGIPSHMVVLYENGFIVENFKKSGKDFVTYAGLLHLAHQMGMVGSNINVLQTPNNDNGNRCIIQAEVLMYDEKTKAVHPFTDIGDASPKDVTEKIIPHLIRMASTRALARAMRQATNVGLTSIEELGNDAPIGSKHSVEQLSESEPQPEPTPKAQPKQKSQPDPQDDELESKEEAEEKHKLIQECQAMAKEIAKDASEEVRPKTINLIKEKIQSHLGIAELPKNKKQAEQITLKQIKNLHVQLSALKL